MFKNVRASVMSMLSGVHGIFKCNIIAFKVR